jgi:hypothetical protein
VLYLGQSDCLPEHIASVDWAAGIEVALQRVVHIVQPRENYSLVSHIEVAWPDTYFAPGASWLHAPREEYDYLVFVFAELAAYTPIWFTLITVCAFGGPHNYAEYRYFLSRLPSRFGPLRAFFITAFAGAIILLLLQIVLTQPFLRNAASNPGARPACFAGMSF